MLRRVRCKTPVDSPYIPRYCLENSVGQIADPFTPLPARPSLFTRDRWQWWKATFARTTRELWSYGKLRKWQKGFKDGDDEPRKFNQVTFAKEASSWYEDINIAFYAVSKGRGGFVWFLLVAEPEWWLSPLAFQSSVARCLTTSFCFPCISGCHERPS